MHERNLPKHIAIIMDGNGRWARAKGLPRVAGHFQGAKVVRAITAACAELGVKALTLYTFSTENWKRPKEEVSALMNLLKENIAKELPSLKKNNVRFNAIGDIGALPKGAQDEIKLAMRETEKNSGIIVTLALNYGSRAEIINAVKNILRDEKAGMVKADGINEELFNKYLYTHNLPEVDLLIRTSGEMRLSNFLLWQLSYSEIYVTEKLWPDFNKEDLNSAISEFSKRQRRFGA